LLVVVPRHGGSGNESDSVASRDEDLSNASAVADTCEQATTCSQCVSSPDCGWCPVEQRCVGGNKAGPFQEQCALFSFMACMEVPCSARTSCSSCLGDLACGWCGTTSTCMPGSASGAVDQASCPTSFPWVHRLADEFTCATVMPTLHPPGLLHQLDRSVASDIAANDECAKLGGTSCGSNLRAWAGPGNCAVHANTGMGTCQAFCAGQGRKCVKAVEDKGLCQLGEDTRSQPTPDEASCVRGRADQICVCSPPAGDCALLPGTDCTPILGEWAGTGSCPMHADTGGRSCDAFCADQGRECVKAARGRDPHSCMLHEDGDGDCSRKLADQICVCSSARASGSSSATLAPRAFGQPRPVAASG